MELDLHFRKLSLPADVTDCLKVEENESREDTLGTISNKKQTNASVGKDGKEERI